MPSPSSLLANYYVVVTVHAAARFIERTGLDPEVPFSNIRPMIFGMMFNANSLGEQLDEDGSRNLVLLATNNKTGDQLVFIVHLTDDIPHYPRDDKQRMAFVKTVLTMDQYQANTHSLSKRKGRQVNT